MRPRGLIERLVAIDSVNPTLVPGGAGEGEIAAFVAAWLERAGLETSLDEAVHGRPNVVGVARGSGGGRSLLLNAHMDTVALGGPGAGLVPRVEGDRLYGRGAYDMKASLAAIMLVGAEVARSPLAGDVIVTAVADEEAESVGMQALVGRIRADGAIVAEPTELGLGLAHKGFVWLELETRGRAAHGSRYDLGVDAIARMGRVLVALEDLDSRLRAGSELHPLLGGGSVHASLIEGGQELSTYPDRCLLKLERRTLPGEAADAVEEEARSLLDNLDGSVRTLLVREPLETSADEPIAAAVRAAAEGVLGNALEPVGLPFWTDAALLAAAGVPTVVFGPSGGGAHAEAEWVDLSSVDRCIEVLGATARAFCA